MAFALAIIGIVLLVAAVRGQTSALFALVQSDFTGQDNFVYWLAAILIIGAFGYIPKARPISTALLGLVVVVLFLKNGGTTGTAGGFFANLTSGLATTTATAASTSVLNPAGATAAAQAAPAGTTYTSGFPSLSSVLDQLGVPGGPAGTPVGPGTPSGVPFPPLVTPTIQ